MKLLGSQKDNGWTIFRYKRLDWAACGERSVTVGLGFHSSRQPAKRLSGRRYCLPLQAFQRNSRKKSNPQQFTSWFGMVCSRSKELAYKRQKGKNSVELRLFHPCDESCLVYQPKKRRVRNLWAVRRLPGNIGHMAREANFFKLVSYWNYFINALS